MKQSVLFLCTGNSCRSQIAEGWLRSLAGDRFRALSAGTHPVGVNPRAVEVMREVGIDITKQRSKNLEEFVGTHIDYVVTVCDRAQASCPVFPGATTRLHWPFDDPAHAEGSEEQQLEVFRRVRDEIGQRITAWLNTSESVVA